MTIVLLDIFFTAGKQHKDPEIIKMYVDAYSDTHINCKIIWCI